MQLDQYEIVRALDFERLGGSEGERKALDILISYIEKTGLPVSIHPFQIHGFDTGEASLVVDGRSWTLHPYGLETEVEIEGELCYLENADALEYNFGAYRGKIVLSFTTSRRVTDLLIGSGVAAYIGISPPHKEALNLSHRQKTFEVGEAVPSATVGYADATELIPLAGRIARIAIRQRVETRIGHNIIVTAGAAERDETLTYLVGHYDSVARSHGSIDNAAGTANLVKACYHFAEHPPERELKIIFFSAEELGLLGSYAYVRDHDEEVGRRGRLVVNVDLSGDPIGQNRFTVLGTKQLLGYVAGVARENGLMFQESLGIYSSDCMPFAVHELPSVNILRSGGRGIHHVHTAGDRARNVTPEGLEDSYRAAEAVLDRVLAGEIYPVRKEIDPSLRERIEKYLWQSLREKPELRWIESYKR